MSQRPSFELWCTMLAFMNEAGLCVTNFYASLDDNENLVFNQIMKVK